MVGTTEVKFKCNIDSVYYTTKKEANDNFGGICNRTKSVKGVRELTPEQLSFNIKHGASFSVAEMNGTTAKDWGSQSLFAVDIDNANANKDLPICTVEDAIRILRENNIEYAIIYNSFSNTEELPKFRIVCVCREVVTCPIEARKMNEAFISLFPQSDPSCKNLDRVYFGTNKGLATGTEVRNVTFDKNILLDLYMKNVYKEPEPIRPSPLPHASKASSFDIEQAIASYPLLQYIESTTGTRAKKHGKDYLINPNPFNGHKDNFFVDISKSPQVYNDFSGGTKGNIINYLMESRSLSKDDARSYFKYELMNVIKEQEKQEFKEAKQAEEKAKKSKTESKPPEPRAKKVPICGNDLMTMHLKPLEYIVDGILATSGVYLLAGASKMGKSWLGIDLSIAVSNGTNILGKTTKQSSTLYIDLESSKRSIKSRLSSMYKNGINIPNWIYLDEFERIGAGFEEDLVELIKERKIKLIVVDVFVKIRSIVQRGATEYQHDYSDLGVLKKIAAEHEVCFLVVTHLRKMKDEDDVFNTMTGSTGIMGASDGALLLARKRGEDHAVLHIDGRDIRNDELALKWNKEATRWECLGKVRDVQEVFKKRSFIDSPFVEALKRLLKDSYGEWNGSARELFNKITFDYADIEGLPLTEAVLGKKLKQDIQLLKEVDITLIAQSSNKGTKYKIKNAVTATTPLTPLTAVTPVTNPEDISVLYDIEDIDNIFIQK